MPVYLATEWSGLRPLWPILAIATVGVVVGTAGGTRLLGGVPERIFRRVVALLLLALGVWMILRG
jgi:uncharacterized membrane protein YfcA